MSHEMIPASLMIASLLVALVSTKVRFLWNGGNQ